jgi:hypothetical protein
MHFLLILTLKHHQDGIWIRRLVRALEQQQQQNRKEVVPIQVVALEDLLGEPFQIETILNHVVGIVNRVSDAASPPLFKACLAVLSAAQIRQIPIVNGPQAYSTCANKWCHHVLFNQAKLASPPTAAFWNDDDDISSRSSTQQFKQAANLIRGADDSEEQDTLLKPNAGGFGAGIVRIASTKSPTNTLIIPSFEDGMSLVQPYVPPKDAKLYRVWFLLGKVQCAVERILDDANDEFTSACAGDACSVRRPILRAWIIPSDVRDELEQRLLPLLPDAHCGSVEFLYNKQGQRLYFDLNLLSTLPVHVDGDSSSAWPNASYDPWQELASACWKIVEHEGYS